MSLLTEYFQPCVMIDKTTVQDGYGGFISNWTDGASFEAAVTKDSSMQARVAAVQGVTSVYTVTTRKNVTLHYHDVFRRTGDGKIFRVTSDGTDKSTPQSASLNMRQVTAEEWSLPNE